MHLDANGGTAGFDEMETKLTRQNSQGHLVHQLGLFSVASKSDPRRSLGFD